MVAAPRTLPDLNQLNPAALIVSQHEQLLSKDAQLSSRDSEIEHLKLLIAKLRRMQFGRKSEKLDRQIEQLELRLDELQATQAENTAASHTPAGVSPVASVAGLLTLCKQGNQQAGKITQVTHPLRPHFHRSLKLSPLLHGAATVSDALPLLPECTESAG